MAIAPGIFRQYDIRGVVDRDLTTDAAHALGGAYAAYLAEHQVRGAVAVGCDNRPSGARLRDALVDGLTGAGVDVVDIGVVPTPLNYWALNKLPVVGGIQITGSHNPPEYNGFKLSVGTGSLHGDEIQRLYQLTQQPAPAAPRARDRARRAGHRPIRRRRGAANRQALASDPRGVRLRQRGRFARRVAAVRATRPGEGKPRASSARATGPFRITTPIRRCRRTSRI